MQTYPKSPKPILRNVVHICYHRFDEAFVGHTSCGKRENNDNICQRNESETQQTDTLNMRKTRKPVFKAGRTCYIMLLLRRSLISSKRNAVLRFPATCHDSDMAISQGTEYAAWRLDLWRKTLFFEKATRKVIHSDTTSRTFFSSLSLILKFWCLVTFLQNLRWPENMEETS